MFGAQNGPRNCLLFFLVYIHSPFADFFPKHEIARFPYPSQSMYIKEGLVSSVALGVQQENYRGKSVGLLRWQTETSFYYTPRISGGWQAQIVAGLPTDTARIISLRYIILNRYHFPQRNWSWRVGPYFGVQSNELKEDAFFSENSEEKEEFILQKRSFLVYGGEIGAGGSFTSMWGWTSGLSVEGLSLAGYVARLSLGGSWNGTALQKRWRENSKGIMGYLEVQLEWQNYSDYAFSPPSFLAPSLVLGAAGAF